MTPDLDMAVAAMEAYLRAVMDCGTIRAGVAWRLLDHLKAIRKAAAALTANEKREAGK